LIIDVQDDHQHGAQPGDVTHGEVVIGGRQCIIAGQRHVHCELLPKVHVEGLSDLEISFQRYNKTRT
jgi:hypothetical protein